MMRAIIIIKNIVMYLIARTIEYFFPLIFVIYAGRKPGPVPKRFFLDTGGFDEYYFYSGEEMDLGFRIWAYGYKVAYAPTAVMYHYMGRTGFRKKARAPTIEYLVMRNKLYYILKNFEPANAARALFLTILASASEIVYCVLHKNIAIPVVVIKAYLTVAKDLGKILRNRKRTQACRKIGDRELYAMGVIVTVRECIKRYAAAARNMEKYFGDIYDTKDAVKIKVDREGNLTFYKA